MVRNLFCILVAAVWTALLFPLTVVAMVVTLDASSSLWVVRRLWSPVLLWAGGARLEVSGTQYVDPVRPQVFVANHQSTIDIPVLFLAVPADFRFVAKHQLRFVPFIGWYMTLAKFPFVDRSHHRRAVASLDKAASQIQRGMSIVMFPEGTRSEGPVLPFKKGPFALALKAGVPIVPIAVEGSGKLMPKNTWNITPGPIRVRFGAPIDPSAFGDNREALMRAVRDRIIEQNQALGGIGGDKDDVVAARGMEGVGRAQPGAI